MEVKAMLRCDDCGAVSDIPDATSLAFREPGSDVPPEFPCGVCGSTNATLLSVSYNMMTREEAERLEESSEWPEEIPG
jgi:hypothetical protein